MIEDKDLLYLAILERSVKWARDRESVKNVEDYPDVLNKYTQDLKDLIGAKI